MSAARLGAGVHVHVSLERDAHGYPPFDAEELDASPVDGAPSLYRVEGVPVFVRGLARGDLVRVVRVAGDDRLWIEETVERSDHWTARVLPWDVSRQEAVASELRDLGCDAHPTRFGVVAVDVPGKVAAATVLEALGRGRDAGRWDYEIGVSPS